MEGLREYGSEADNAAITAKLRDIRLAEIHEHVMDELVNGPERRRKQEEAREYERQMLTQGKLAQQQHTAAQQAHQQAYQNQYANQLGQSLGQYSQAQAVGIVGKSPNSIWVDEYANIANTGTIVATQPETTLSTSTINAIKKALKLWPSINSQKTGSTGHRKSGTSLSLCCQVQQDTDKSLRLVRLKDAAASGLPRT
jgi:hypothetical protein